MNKNRFNEVIHIRPDKDYLAVYDPNTNTAHYFRKEEDAVNYCKYYGIEEHNIFYEGATYESDTI